MSQTKTASILTIIAPEGQALLNDKALSNIKDKLEIESEPQWLASDEAVDLKLDVEWNQKQALNDIKTKISDLLQDQPFDFALQASEHRRKKPKSQIYFKTNPSTSPCKQVSTAAKNYSSQTWTQQSSVKSVLMKSLTWPASNPKSPRLRSAPCKVKLNLTQPFANASDY